MATKREPKPYKYVNHVTDEQIDAFVEKFISDDNTGHAADSLANAGIMTWPDFDQCGCDQDDPTGQCSHQRMYLDDQNEILARMWRRITPALRKAFRESAEEVLSPLSRPIHAAAEEIARAIPEFVLHSTDTEAFMDLVLACRPDLSTEGLGDDDRDEAEAERRMDAQTELGEAIINAMQPEFSRVLTRMFIDAANKVTLASSEGRTLCGNTEKDIDDLIASW